MNRLDNFERCVLELSVEDNRLTAIYIIILPKEKSAAKVAISYPSYRVDYFLLDQSAGIQDRNRQSVLLHLVRILRSYWGKSGPDPVLTPFRESS